jgi:HEAT repeat protein
LRQLTTRDDAEVSEAANRLLRRLAGPATAGTILQALRDATDTEASQLAYLTEVLGQPIGRHLLVQMCETEDRGERRRGFDFVQRLGSRIVPDALDLLRDTRWYVVRNMLQVLQTTGDPRMIARVRVLVRHGDPRVRLEAAKVLVRHDAAVTPDLLEPLLTDENPTVQEGVMAAVGRDRVRAAVPSLLALATRRSAFGGSRTIRLRALRCLGEIGDSSALPGLRRYFSGLGATAEEKRAAFASLAGYPPAARSELVERGLTSNDPEIRALCRRLAGEETDG